MSGRKFVVVAASVATLMSAAVVTAPLADAKPKAPSKVAKARVASVSTTAASLTWKNPKSKNFTATVVRIAAGTKAPKSVKAGRGVATVAKRRHAVSIGRLAAGTTYTVALFSSDGKKHYSKATAVRVQTSPAGVTNLAAQATFNTLRLSWSYLPSPSSAGVIVRYAKGGVAPASPTSGTAVPTAGKVAGTKVSGLRLGSTYAFSVWARDAAGRVSSRTVATFTTPSTTTGALSGLVTGGVSGKPLGDVEVDAYRYDDNGDDDFVDDVNSGADGRYAFGNLNPGRYYLCFYASDATGGDSQAGYLYRCTDDFQVVAGDPAAVGSNLEAGAGFSGTVTDAVAPNAALENVQVESRDGDDESNQFDITDADGKYSLLRVPVGTTKTVCFSADADVDDANSFGYQEHCVSVSPVAGKITPLSVTLAQGGAFAGALDLNGATDASILVFDQDGKVLNSSYAEDGDAQQYKIGGLATASYTVCVVSYDSDYDSQCYDGTADGTPWDGDTDNLPAAADVKPVEVEAGKTMSSGIDFTLQAAP